jgi:hypothetical protein
MYETVSKSFRTCRLTWEMQMVQLSATRCSCIAILWVSLVSFAAITLCVAFQRVVTVVSVYFVIDPVRKLLRPPPPNRICDKQTWHLNPQLPLMVGIVKFVFNRSLLCECFGKERSWRPTGRTHTDFHKRVPTKQTIWGHSTHI